MSHDCDCDSCQASDSRWAYTRKMEEAKRNDCPKGKHIASLWSTRPRAGEAEYRCAACQLWCDRDGKLCGVYEPEPRKVINMTEARRIANEALRALEAPPCPKHKRYQAKRKPRLPCEWCWRKYVLLNPR